METISTFCYPHSPSCLVYKHTPGYLLPRQDTGILLHNSDPQNLITYDTTILTYGIELHPLEIKLVLIYWIMNILQSYISLIQSQINHLFIKFQHRLKKCVDHSYQRVRKRAYNRSIFDWWTKLTSKSTWKIKGQDQSIHKEEIPYKRSWIDSLHIWSSQTCSFTPWILSPK